MKPRVIFTIILNGKHHLEHNDYARTLACNCDKWIITEGAVKPNGSTSWCKPISERYQHDGHSVDGTVEYLIDLSNKYDNIHLVLNKGLWESKDEQVNACIRRITDQSCFLWEVDCDEQWDPANMTKAEKYLTEWKAKTGCFYADYFVGKDLIAKGEWGEGHLLPYRRLWDWKGELFSTHEPPTLAGQNEPFVTMCEVRFRHYAYYYDQDVQFKNDFYSGHEGILEKWRDLQEETIFPQPISRLIVGPWGKTQTTIEKVALE